jgi:hypothetical protein
MFPSRQKILLMFGTPSKHYLEALVYPTEVAAPPFFPRTGPDQRTVLVLPGAHYTSLPAAEDFARFLDAFPKARLLFLAAVPCRRTVLLVVNAHRMVVGLSPLNEKTSDDLLAAAMRGTVVVVRGDAMPVSAHRFETSSYNLLYPYPEHLYEDAALARQPALFSVYPVATPKVAEHFDGETELRWINVQGGSSPKIERVCRDLRGGAVLLSHCTPKNDLTALLQRYGVRPLGQSGPGPFFATDVADLGGSAITVLSPDELGTGQFAAVRHVYVLDPPEDIAYLLWHFPDADATLLAAFYGPGEKEALDLFKYRVAESEFLRSAKLIVENSVELESPSHATDPYLKKVEGEFASCDLLEWGLGLFKLKPIVSYIELTYHLELYERPLRRESVKLVTDYFSNNVVEDLNGILGKITQSEHFFKWEPL